jgi:hypothetical protein
MRSTVSSCLALILLASACASGSGGAGASTSPTSETNTGAATTAKRRVGSSRNVITAEELASAHVSTVYEAIERLRPHFLQTHGAVSMQDMTADILVYMDNVRLGGVDVLRRVEPGQVQEVRYVNAKDATTRYGTGHGGGVIEVTSKGTENR